MDGGRRYVRRETLARFSHARPPLGSDVAGDVADLPPLALKLKRAGSDSYAATLPAQRRSVLQFYLAAVRQMDNALSRVLTALERSAHRSSTVVVFTSDHGWHAAGEKRQYKKFTVWRRVTHVPLLIRVPAGVSAALPRGTAAGASCGDVVSLLDVYPTLAALAAIPPELRQAGPHGAAEQRQRSGLVFPSFPAVVQVPALAGSTLLPLLRAPVAAADGALSAPRRTRRGVLTSTQISPPCKRHILLLGGFSSINYTTH